MVTTGGLGPTPDDLTRESIAQVCGEVPAEDPTIEAWLRERFERRGLPYVDANRKQAWLIPSATALPNPNGTAPGWWVERPDGRVIVALPGPPREMQPMWRDEVLPRLRARGLGADRAAETLPRGHRRVDAGAAHRRGGAATAQPEVATYARVDAVDVRVSAVGDGGRTARELVDAELARLEPLVGRYVFARGADGWPQALGARLAGRTLATLEQGTAGLLAGALATEPWLTLAEARPPGSFEAGEVPALATGLLDRGPADVALALVATEQAGDMQVVVAITDGANDRVESHTAFLGGDMGRRRAVNLACLTLWRWLGTDPPG
ncbi:MAG: molybdopterin-binding protein [Chloroflexota bacterium]